MSLDSKEGLFKQGLVMPCRKIQPAIWPEREVSTEIMPYLALSGLAVTSLDQGGIIFGSGGTAMIDGYFNLFNLGKWRAFCGDTPIALWLNGQGRFHLTVNLVVHDRSIERLFSEVITLEGEASVALDLSTALFPRMLLTFELTALEEGHLVDFAWTTSAPPHQTPELLVSVTTFKREAAVAATVERFQKFRETSPLRDYIHMAIIDNGQSLNLDPVDGVTVVPNANLGGAGGFARGLLEARSRGATHCLFMDDDASVHMGAIIRTWMFLAYATDPRTTVAGAMINDAHRWKLWENGAVFHRGCHPLFFGCDMRERRYGLRKGKEHEDTSFQRDRFGLRKKFDPSNSVLNGFNRIFDMEFATTEPRPKGFYGGWWFFAFPVDQVAHLPFPFFVRGDDVSFSIANDLRIITLPGVASFQESFTDKASPLTWYLDMRSHLAHHLSLPQMQVPWISLQRMFLSFYLRTVLRFHYDSLSAVNLAIEDVLRGPDFFAENADMVERRKTLKEMTTTEAWQQIETAPPPKHAHLSRWKRALLFITLNGHLLPFSNLFGSRLVIEPLHRENYREAYGAREITYLNVPRTAAYTVRRNRRRFFTESLRLLRNSLKLRSRYVQQHLMWQGAYAGLTSEVFWKDRLGLSSDKDHEKKQSY